MKNQLFIPKKIKVGYQNRQGTYTNKLAYVIYYDNKNVLRKEASWQSWRDNKLPPDDFENVPTEGFVMNKKAGGYDSGWNHRQTYCRIWDPRGFEFEINIPNLLYILQETSSVKGKGLEGEFVYAWDGKDLVLLPVSAPEFSQSNDFSELQGKKVAAKDLVLGYTYLNKDQNSLVYMGKHVCLNTGHWKSNNFSKDFVFYDIKKNDFVNLPSVASLSKVSVEEEISNFAELLEALDNSELCEKINEVFTERLTVPTGYGSYYGHNKLTVIKTIFKEVGENNFEVHRLIGDTRNVSQQYRGYSYSYPYKAYYTQKTGELKFENGVVTIKTTSPSAVNDENIAKLTKYSADDIRTNYRALFVKQKQTNKRIELNS